MSLVADSVIGRDEELGKIAAFLDASAELPGALLLEGDAGMGKTTLWRGGIELATERSYRVLRAAPTGSEMQLSFAGLRDLLEGVVDEVLPQLPKPQRRGLAIALLREEADGRRPERHTIAVAFLTSVRVLARERPLLIAVDDVQWLDTPSAVVLEFAARRLAVAKVALFLSRRVEGFKPLPLGLDRALPRERVLSLALRPLTLGAIHHLLRQRLGMTFPRPALRRLHEVSGGNPFFALELARAVELRGGGLADPGLSLPADLASLVRDRLVGLPLRTRDALVALAALAQPTVELAERVLGARAHAALRPAVDAHIVELEQEKISFAHPLFASAIYAEADARRRRALHKRLARVVIDPEERARHLALATAQTDTEVARLVQEAARRAHTRGAPTSAAELLEHAVRLTPADEEAAWAERSIDAADCHVEAGDRQRARALLESLVERLGSGPLRSDALVRLARLVPDVEDLDRSIVLCEQALQEAGNDPARAAGALLVLAHREVERRKYPKAIEAARGAVELAESADDRELLAHGLAELGLAEALTWDGKAEGHLRRAQMLDPDIAQSVDFRAPRMSLSIVLTRKGEFAAARDLLLEQYRRSLDTGDEESRARLCELLTENGCFTGDFDGARRWAEEGHELAEQSGDKRALSGSLYARAFVEAFVGNADTARGLAEEGLALAISIGAAAAANLNRIVLRFLALSLGDYASAAQALTEEFSLLAIDHKIEALIALGKYAEAEPMVGELERRGREMDNPRLLASAARCRGLLLAATGDLDGAFAALARGLREHERVAAPFERARTLLALGQIQRRAKRKRAARDRLEQALATFDELGARLWAEKARAELARIGGRGPSEGRLTVSERRLADLVAEGRSNKEIAAALFVTPKTVGTKLSRIYAKLGVHSRTELVRHLADRSTSKV